MKKQNLHIAVLVLVLGAAFGFAGCHKRVATASHTPPAPPPAPAMPTVTLNASPSNITQGQTATLTWSSLNATELTLTPGIGAVNKEGAQQVSPNGSTTYTIKATGTGGSAEASARITVTVPPPVPAHSENLEEMFQAAVKDAFFDFNGADIRQDAQEALKKDAEFLDLHPQIRVSIEGHCDERGSEEYNLGLGDRRANAVKEALGALGISGDRIRTLSYGKERPVCTDENEECWQRNRRGQFQLDR